MKYIEKIQKFMYGRYGPDNLYHFLFKLYLGLFLIDIIIENSIITYIELLVIVIMFYRFFSKNIYKRSNENKIFLKYSKKVTKPIRNITKNFKRKIKNFKDKSYVYKKCFKCKTIIRLPLPDNYGIKHVKCPKCKKRLHVICLKKNSIEVIKKTKRR